MILVDTSVWIDHLRAGVPSLAHALDQGRVLMHPFVIGELACGNLGNRTELLRLLGELPRVEVAEHDEVLVFIEAHALMGRGIGYVDAHLLASTALEGDVRLWTRDRRLDSIARDLGFASDDRG
jgi:predicted nucleic acid-binding protein